jgi:hypothetical protein
MPVSVVQSNAGGFNSTTGSATLPSGTTAGTTLLLIVGLGSGSTNLSPNPPTGFTPAGGEGPVFASDPKVLFYRKSNVAAGETSWTIAMGVAGLICWSVLEVDGLDLTTPKDVGVASASTATAATSVSTGTSATSTTYDAFVVAAHLALNATNTTVPTWSGQTNGFDEVTDAGIAGASTAAGLAVSVQSTGALGAFSSTGTSSVTGNLASTLVVYTTAGARRLANVVNMAGAEQGTQAGLTTGTLGNTIFDFQAGTPTVVTTVPRSGSYCYRITGSAAVANFGWSNTASLGSSTTTGVLRVCFLFEGALPTSDVEIASFGTTTVAANQLAILRYRSASQKVGMQARDLITPANGTEQLSAATVAADTWYAVDLRFDGSQTSATSGSYLVDWALDAVAQTQATVAAPATTGGVSAVTLGPLTAPSGSYTIRYDDIVFSRTAGHFPLGDFRILPLRPDPAGTLTISGTTGNFQTFSNNGTMAAWNAATALAAIDDLPPTIGATADGIAQITVAATDYVNIPMETYDAASNGAALRAVRMYAAGWGAGSPAAATIGFRGFDGTTETVLLAAADPTFTNSTTTPGWVAKMFKPTGGWTQTKLDALTFRVGFSGDATPDIGIHSIMAEVAVRADPQTVRVAEVTGLEGVTSTAFVDARLDADSGAPIAYDATPAPDFDAAVTYTERGADTNTPLPAGAAVATEIVGADTVDDVTNLSIGPA